jgi:hypothetical protein
MKISCFLMWFICALGLVLEFLRHNYDACIWICSTVFWVATAYIYMRKE